MRIGAEATTNWSKLCHLLAERRVLSVLDRMGAIFDPELDTSPRCKRIAFARKNELPIVNATAGSKTRQSVKKETG